MLIRTVTTLGILAAIASISAGGEPPEMTAWKDYFVGSWNRTVSVTVDGETTTETVEWSCKRLGEAIVTSGKTIEDTGYAAFLSWDGVTESVSEVGKLDNGASWSIQLKIAGDEKLTGSASGVLDDGRKGRGTCTIERTSGDAYSAVFELKLDDGSTFRVSAKNSRKKSSLPAHVHAQLAKLVGDWTLVTDVDGNSYKESISIKWAEDESNLIYQFDGVEFATGRPFRGTGLVGWDAASQTVREFSLSNTGNVFEAVFDFEDGGSIWQSPTKGTTMEGGSLVSFRSHRVIEWLTADKFTVSSSNRFVNGVKADPLTSTLTRR